MRIFERNFWLLVKPADDVPGQWVGHCLELDILSVGESLREAIRMTSEAMCESIVDDIGQGRSPLERRPAPPEYTTELNRVLSEGQQLQLAQLAGNERGTVALQIHFHLEQLEAEEPTRALVAGEQVAPQYHPHPQLEQLPPAWLMAKYNSQSRAGAPC